MRKDGGAPRVAEPSREQGREREKEEGERWPGLAGGGGGRRRSGEGGGRRNSEVGVGDFRTRGEKGEFSGREREKGERKREPVGLNGLRDFGLKY